MEELTQEERAIPGDNLFLSGDAAQRWNSTITKEMTASRVPVTKPVQGRGGI